VLASGALAATPAVAPAAAPAPAPASSAPEPPPPEKPREFYNAGTKKLAQGKLKEAETLLETALGSQTDRFQPPALYNLGHVRFRQGIEELKKGPAARAAADDGARVSQQASETLRALDEALAGDDLRTLVGAYLRGRGQRRELKAALGAVRRALAAHRATLARWQRALGDFHSTVELIPADGDARHNAEVVDRCIAKLVDMMRELELLANAMGNQRREMGAKMKMIKGRVPAQDAPPGAAGDEEDEDEEDQPSGPQPGQTDSPTTDGDEMTLTREQAGWLLDGFRLDFERRLPMGKGPEGNTRDRKRQPW
jgi:tetratricopeptide (TPR) repeat protein